MLVSILECILFKICNGYSIKVRHRIMQQTDTRMNGMNGRVKTLAKKLFETNLTNTNKPYNVQPLNEHSFFLERVSRG